MYLEGGHVAGNANGVHDLHLLTLHNATVVGVGGWVVVVSTTTALWGHSWLQMVMKAY
jgi:hypothetical protein